MKLKNINKSLICDAIYNLSARESGDNHEYGKGVLLGVVAAIMSMGKTFDEAAEFLKPLLPSDAHPDRIPELWRHRLVDDNQQESEQS